MGRLPQKFSTFGSQRLRLPFSFIVLIATGAAGLWYVLAPSGLEGLFLYALGLITACALVWPISASLDLERDREHAASQQDVEVAAARPAQCEIVPPRKTVRRRSRTNQKAFDFDGMAALRARENIDGAWLVAEASLEVIEIVRAACRASSPQNARMDRWFEIVLALNTARHAKDEKAEVRRTQVAKTYGVSEEQARQIDQGRYTPLNKVIAQINPSEL